MSKLRTLFLAGLLLLLPLFVTIWVVRLIVQTLDQTLLLLPEGSRPQQLLGYNVPGLGVLLALVIVLAAGLLAKNILGQRLVLWGEKIVSRIPVVRPVYSGVKQISESLFTEKGQAFRRALLVEWPYRGMWTIAFQTGAPSDDIRATVGEDAVNLYIPTTPNPTGGYFVMVPRSATRALDISVDEALKLVLSMGVVNARKGSLAAAVPPANIPPASQTSSS